MHVVVTGGSSGIGLEVAKIYAAKGVSVSIVARNPERLQSAHERIESVAAVGAKIFSAAADVADPVALSAAIAACEAVQGPCDTLVVSAGIVDPAWFYEQSDEAFRAMWETNFHGAVNAVRAVYQGMRKRREGRIMIVSSAAALIGIPAYAGYCGSKAALVGFVDSLRLEAIPDGISVGICFPPDTDTPQLAWEVQCRPREAQMLMGKVKPRRAENIAADIVDGIAKGRARVYFTLSIAALSIFGPAIKPFVELWYRLRVGR
ncbi:SDR family NAD(P)-dependent oxidoreductase [Aliirhizobium terrae]|uniref:SDR family NAD(P)-dependent oxidoreductase n=1 Tax=Terrirhizobium terrae TaxID=2926709 RepID=UPI0025774CC5|nr:SDR family NAD(P)-dependent oxidoreductase [Rhizobium sp. CC-CFT758]WJH39644.1 SDR family NAD(P)-dependent oxidoreductase [Rhizobium sp. CC-CFT758]